MHFAEIRPRGRGVKVWAVDVCVLDVSLVGALSEQQEPFVGNLGLLKGAHRLNDARGR